MLLWKACTSLRENKLIAFGVQILKMNEIIEIQRIKSLITVQFILHNLFPIGNSNKNISYIAVLLFIPVL